jgi:hypothetical protein
MLTDSLADFRQDLQRVDAPTLIVHGDADRIVPIDASARRTKATLRDSRSVEIPGGSHGIDWTNAGEVNRELLGFLGERRTSRLAPDGTAPSLKGGRSEQEGQGVPLTPRPSFRRRAESG